MKKIGIVFGVISIVGLGIFLLPELDKNVVNAGGEITVIATIPVGTNPQQVVITPGGEEVYVSNRGGNTVSVIDTNTNTVTNTIGVGTNPYALAISPDGAKVYVGNQGSGTVSVIDTATKSVVGTVYPGRVEDLAISPDGEKIYVTPVYGYVKKIRTSDLSVSTVGYAGCPMTVVFTPDGTRAYVNTQCAPSPGSSGHDPIYIFDAVNDIYVGAIWQLPDGTRMRNVGSAMGISPDGTQFWANGSNACAYWSTSSTVCPSPGSGIINVIRTADNSVIKTLFGSFGQISFSPDSSQAYVGGPSLNIYNTATFEVVDSVDIAGSGSLAFTPDGTKAYAPVPAENAVKVLQIVAPTNLPPVADANGPYQDNEGSLITFDGSGFYDPDGTIVLYEWDLDCDGLYDDTTGINPTSVWGDDYSGCIGLKVTDDGGLTDTDSTAVTVNNVAPTVDVGLDQEVYAGDTVSFSGSFTDLGWLDTHTGEWDFGDDTTQAGILTEENNPPDATGEVTGSHIYYEAEVYTVTLTVTDDDGGVGTDTLAVTVNPIPATIDCDPDTLNLKSKGQWITCYIELPDGPQGQQWDVWQIDGSTILLNGAVPAYLGKQGWAKAESNESNIMDSDNDGGLERMVKFDWQAVQEVLEAGKAVILTLTGKVFYNAGYADFEGLDTIRVIDKGKK